MKEIVIPFSKRKIFSFLFFNFIICVASIFLILTPNTFEIGVAGLFFLYLMRGDILIQNFFASDRGLVMNDMGIVDNQGYLSGELIPWKHITKIGFQNFRQKRLILVFVDNIFKEGLQYNLSLRGKFLMLINNIFYFSPINISNDYLKCKFDDLRKIIESEFEKHKFV